MIHKAIQWKKMLDDGEVGSLSELAKKVGLTRARVTQIMNLLKLPEKAKKSLRELDDPKIIRRYSERRLRQSLNSFFI
jgi:DNA-directed RNA polymerase sigma subunit (sigma70/sigma32)